MIRLETVDGGPIDTWLTLGEVVAVHIAKRLLRDGNYDTAAARPILRGGASRDGKGIRALRVSRGCRNGRSSRPRCG